MLLDFIQPFAPRLCHTVSPVFLSLALLNSSAQFLINDLLEEIYQLRCG